LKFVKVTQLDRRQVNPTATSVGTRHLGWSTGEGNTYTSSS